LALSTHDLNETLRAAVAVVQALLDCDLVLVLRLLPRGEGFLLESGADPSGWLGVGARIPIAAARDAEAAMRSAMPVVIEDPVVDTDVQPFVSLRGRGSLAMLAPIPSEEGTWGLLAAFSTSATTFAIQEVHFARAVAAAIASASAYCRAQSTLTALIEESADPVARFDADLRVEYVNPAMVLATGVAADDMLGRTFREIDLLGAQLDGLEALFYAVMRSRREREAAFPLSSPIGRRFYRVRFVPELAADGNVRSVLAIARDLTEYQTAEAERASLQRELLDRDRRHEDLVQQLLAEQQRSTEVFADESYRSEIIRQLTSRETDILRLLASGLTNRQIANRLHLSAGTVRNHLGRVFPKLDAVDRTQAAVRAVELGLLRSEEA